MSKCRIPVGAVAKRGLFRILLGSTSSSITDTVSKSSDYTMSDGTVFTGAKGETISVVDYGYNPGGKAPGGDFVIITPA